MRRIKPSYTTGDVAALFGVDARTVAHRADSGCLPCVRRPGGTHRRFPHAALVRWLMARSPEYDPLLRRIAALGPAPGACFACGDPGDATTARHPLARFGLKGDACYPCYQRISTRARRGRPLRPEVRDVRHPSA